MDEELLVLAEIVGKLRKQVQEIDSSISEISKLEGPQGLPGKDGKDGKDGKTGPKGADGRDGLNGNPGKDGKDGADGVDGKDGRSIVDVYWAADGSLVCVLSDGTEIDTGPLIGGGDGGNINATVNQWAGYSAEELKQTLVAKTFETVNKNLEASAGTLAYNVDGDLLTITYDNGVVKTLAYDANNDLESVTLSGNTPEGIDLIKTFSYNISGDLVSFSYA